MTRARDLADGADKDISGTLTLDDIVLSNDMSVADNGKVQFGAGSDLQIYHDGSHSRIYDNGGGELKIMSNGTAVRIQKDNGENMILANTDGAVNIYHDGSAKLATTSTGVDVTGTMTVDGITSSQDINITESIPQLNLIDTDGTNVQGSLVQAGGNLLIRSRNGTSTFGSFIFARNNGADTNVFRTFSNGDFSLLADDGTTEALRFDASTQRLGLGTTSPSRNLHVKGGIDTRIRTEESGGSLVDLTVTNSGHFIDSTSTGDLTINKSGSANMIFKTTNAERMRIDSSGKISVNTSSVAGTGWVQINAVTADALAMRFKHNGATVGSINTSSSSTSYNTSSDYRLKENVTDITDATTRLKQLNPVRFNFIANADTTVDGFLAHEVQDIVPEAITGAKDAVDADGNPEYQGIDQSKLVPLLTAALQEALTKIDALETRIVALEA